MIAITDKKKCCGCKVCSLVCTQKCISMVIDSEGFEYPEVNIDMCSKCGECKKKCPILASNRAEKNKKFDSEMVPQSYASFLKDEKIRKESTSGGFFTAVAEYVIEKQGVVFGVEVDSEMKVKHSYSETIEGLERFRGSKYVQSDPGLTFKIVQNFLLEKRIVLYTGTPCQIYSLKLFLNEDFQNLITIDIFCHGVGSPLYWEKYVLYMKKKYKSEIKKIKFREKTYGYNSACLAVYFENGVSVQKGHDDDLYWSAFSKNYIFRPACYSCVFKTVNHNSDFTIGDYWSTNNLGKQFNKSNGCSLVICQSSKSEMILSKIKEKIEFEKVDFQEALKVNGGHQDSMLISVPKEPQNRTIFFEDLLITDINRLISTYIPLKGYKKILCILKPILYKFKVLDLLKKMKGKSS